MPLVARTRQEVGCRHDGSSGFLEKCCSSVDPAAALATFLLSSIMVSFVTEKSLLTKWQFVFLIGCAVSSEAWQGSQLALPFMQLPSRKDYPDYYKVIKNPMDLHMISRKRSKYETLEDAVEDFVLVFDNAMQYNVEGSQIFRNAKTLSRIAQHWRPEEI